MTPMSKRILMAALVAGSGVLAASTFAMPGGGPGQPGCAAPQAGKAQSQREAFRAQRLANLKEKLKLQPGQEAAWQAFAGGARPGPGRPDRQALRAEMAKLSVPERMDKMLSLADTRREHMVQRAQAVKQFYAQLSPEQQKVFDAEAQPFRHGKHGQRGGRGQPS